jgi:glycosyltransferase involved in cell wall biosynthesis
MGTMPKREPIVSIIIPTYNSSGTLRLALQTVLLQDFKDFEVWIIGDGCTDNSDKVVTSFEDDRLNWINLGSNSGNPSLPRNEGLRRSKGQFIAYLGHDDLWFPWHLSELVDFIQKNNCDFVYSLGALIAPNGLIGTFTLHHRLSIGYTISPSNWLHNKNLAKISGGWSQDIKYSHDKEFLQRILSSNVKLKFCRRLSVLKFPSRNWQMYSLNEDLPQTPYIQSLQQDSKKLHDELLLTIATIMSHKKFMFNENRNIFYRFFVEFIGNAIDMYGQYRWPLNTLLYQRWRRKTGLARSQ